MRAEIEERIVGRAMGEPTLAILQTDGLSMLNAAAAADRTGGPVAKTPLMLPSVGHIEGGQRELVVDARVALIAPHDSLQNRIFIDVVYMIYNGGLHLRRALWRAVWAEVF